MKYSIPCTKLKSNDPVWGSDGSDPATPEQIQEYLDDVIREEPAKPASTPKDDIDKGGK